MKRVPIVFLLDFDNTLVDNDAAKEDLGQIVRAQLGPELAERFWANYEAVRADLDVVDIPETLRRFRGTISDLAMQDLQNAIWTYDYGQRMYPGVPALLAQLNAFGQPVVLSDGDEVFQRHKIIESGVAAMVRTRMLIYVHKEDHLVEISERYPAEHYVFIDDKPRVLSACKAIMHAPALNILVRQGKYALTNTTRHDPPPDREVDCIGDLLTWSAGDFMATAIVPC